MTNDPDVLNAATLVPDPNDTAHATKLHRYLGITQKTAWFMLGRIREALA